MSGERGKVSPGPSGYFGTTYLLLQVGDEVIAILILLQASERHLCTGDVLWDEVRERFGPLGVIAYLLRVLCR